LVADVVMDVAVAEPGGDHPDRHLLILWLVYLDVTHFPVTGRLEQECCA
jgi:hypothetical protein